MTLIPKHYHLRLTDDGTLELYVDNCLRKGRPRTGREPLYVWTNVELEWEEHHYIEARYWSSSGRLQVTVNGDPDFDESVAPVLAIIGSPVWVRTRIPGENEENDDGGSPAQHDGRDQQR